jgi:uncharacterized protein YbjT (DUF2867 family)
VILVTGSTGLTGRAVARSLNGRVPLRLALRDLGAATDLAVRAERVRFDFDDPASFGPALSGITGVYLLRPPAMARPAAFEPLLAAMRAAGVRRVAFLSVRGAGSIPVLPHRGIERRIEGSGLAWTHLRPSDFMQNFETVHRTDIRDRGELWAPAGSGRANWVDVRDVAEAVARVLTEGGHEYRAYSLTGPEALSFEDAARLFSAHIGHDVVYRRPSLPRYLWHQHRAGQPAAFALVMAGIYTAQRLGLAAGKTPDLPCLIGRAPGSLERYIAECAGLRRNPGVPAAAPA